MPRKKTPVEVKPVTNEDILEAVKSAKISILRGMHSGDKVANALVNLVEATRRLGQITHLALFDTPEWRDAEAIVLRINEIKGKKESEEE